APGTDYSQPGGPVKETTIPAGKASIEAIAALHSLVTLALLADPVGYNPGFTSLLLTLQRVPDVFDEAFRPYRFRVARRADCLICRPQPTPSSSEELDVALDQALARLGDASPGPRARAGPPAAGAALRLREGGLAPARPADSLERRGGGRRGVGAPGRHPPPPQVRLPAPPARPGAAAPRNPPPPGGRGP